MHARERAIAAFAARQDNVISWSQLVEAGLGRGALAHRLQGGTMQRLHRGVYLLGAAPPTPVSKARAAVLAYGERAVLSHRSAAWLWRLLPECDGEVHVTVVGRNPGARAGVKLHRAKTLASREVRLLRSLPVTSPARTICDVAASEPLRDSERALAEARVLRLLTNDELKAAIAQAPRRKGVAVVRTLLEQARGQTLTRSEAERKLLTLAREAQLPIPLTNVRVHGHEVDFLWPAQRLIVEMDGYAFHSSRGAFERDRKRDQALVAAGYRVIRVTWRQLVEEPLALIARIAQALPAAA